MGGDINGTEVHGVVVEWVSARSARSTPDARVRLDRPLTASGALITQSNPDADGSEGEVTGRFLMLSTRYAGHTWDGEQTTVHVPLNSGETPDSTAPTVWVTAHGVWSHAQG